MGIMVSSLLWVMQDVYHQPYVLHLEPLCPEPDALTSLLFEGFRVLGV